MSIRQALDSLGLLPLALVLSASACSLAGVPPDAGDVLSGAVRQERLFRTPGGQTRIEQWTTPGEPIPRVVRVQRYVSGLSLAPGIALVFHAGDQEWKLSLQGRMTPLESLPVGKGALPLLAPGTPVLEQYVFDHDGRKWQLAILSRQEPVTLPGIATEDERSLDLLLWLLPLR